MSYRDVLDRTGSDSIENGCQKALVLAHFPILSRSLLLRRRNMDLGTRDDSNTMKIFIKRKTAEMCELKPYPRAAVFC